MRTSYRGRSDRHQDDDVGRPRSLRGADEGWRRVTSTPTMVHRQDLRRRRDLVDDRTLNFDNRALALNVESNLWCSMEPSPTRDLDVPPDLEHATEIKLETFARRPGGADHGKGREPSLSESSSDAARRRMASTITLQGARQRSGGAAAVSNPRSGRGSVRRSAPRAIHNGWGGRPSRVASTRSSLAPTGTGKTLAAFLWSSTRHHGRTQDNRCRTPSSSSTISPPQGTQQRHPSESRAPARALARAVRGRGPRLSRDQGRGTHGRTTPASARARMMLRTPHILITTPESLNIMLTSVKGGHVSLRRAVSVDEIHAVAGSKRGAHLASRSNGRCATGRSPHGSGCRPRAPPLDEVARFLGGLRADGAWNPWIRGESRITIEAANPGSRGTRRISSVASGENRRLRMTKAMSLAVASPVGRPGHRRRHDLAAVAELLLHHIRHRERRWSSSTTAPSRAYRRAGECIAREVARRTMVTGAGAAISSWRPRCEAARCGALITTISLERPASTSIGDLVLQLQSPAGDAALQRVGRAGHTSGPRAGGARAEFRDDAVEIAAIVAAMRAGEVEPTQVVPNALDVLRRSSWRPSRSMTGRRTPCTGSCAPPIPYLGSAGGIRRGTRDALRQVPVRTRCRARAADHLDRVNDRLIGGSRASRMTAVISGGPPDRGLYTVNLPDRTRSASSMRSSFTPSRSAIVFQLGSTTGESPRSSMTASS